jgi:hypothetical protein
MSPTPKLQFAVYGVGVSAGTHTQPILPLTWTNAQPEIGEL